MRVGLVQRLRNTATQTDKSPQSRVGIISNRQSFSGREQDRGEDMNYLFFTVGVKCKHSHGAVGCAAPRHWWHDMIARLIWTWQAQDLVGMFIC